MFIESETGKSKVTAKEPPAVFRELPASNKPLRTQLQVAEDRANKIAEERKSQQVELVTDDSGLAALPSEVKEDRRDMTLAGTRGNVISILIPILVMLGIIAILFAVIYIGVDWITDRTAEAILNGTSP